MDFTEKQFICNSDLKFRLPRSRNGTMSFYVISVGILYMPLAEGMLPLLHTPSFPE